jgi:hypothetical protein
MAFDELVVPDSIELPLAVPSTAIFWLAGSLLNGAFLRRTFLDLGVTGDAAAVDMCVGRE